MGDSDTDTLPVLDCISELVPDTLAEPLLVHDCVGDNVELEVRELVVLLDCTGELLALKLMCPEIVDDIVWVPVSESKGVVVPDTLAEADTDPELDPLEETDTDILWDPETVIEDDPLVLNVPVFGLAGIVGNGLPLRTALVLTVTLGLLEPELDPVVDFESVTDRVIVPEADDDFESRIDDVPVTLTVDVLLCVVVPL